MTHLVPLSFIEQNPWQPRQMTDPEKIAELAESIQVFSASRPETFGLLQVPSGRIVNTDEIPPEGNIGEWLMDQQASVQLAFGHRRLAAFRLLGRGLFPVELARISDEEMASQAWFENEQHVSLNPIERARWIERSMQDFKWTQSQAADKLKKSRPVVANMLRLLKLPEDLQSAIRGGKLSERQALALVQLLDLPEQIRSRAEHYIDTRTKPSVIIEDALAGESSNKLRTRVSLLIANYGRDLSRASWGKETAFEGQNIHSPVCSGCEYAVDHNGREYCVLVPCFESKDMISREEYLQKQVDSMRDANQSGEPKAQAEAAPASAWPPAEVPADHRQTEIAGPFPQTSMPASTPAREPAPIAPSLAPEPEPPPPWERTYITITLTCMPEDVSGNRSISLGARAGNTPPIMRMLSGNGLLDEGPIADLLFDLRRQYESNLDKEI